MALLASRPTIGLVNRPRSHAATNLLADSADKQASALIQAGGIL